MATLPEPVIAKLFASAMKLKSQRAIFDLIKKNYDESFAPLLHRQIKEFSVSRPFEGLTVLQSSVLTITASLKVRILCARVCLCVFLWVVCERCRCCHLLRHSPHPSFICMWVCIVCLCMYDLPCMRAHMCAAIVRRLRGFAGVFVCACGCVHTQLEALIAGGADLVVTPCAFVASDPRAIALLKVAGVELYEDHAEAIKARPRYDLCVFAA